MCFWADNSAIAAVKPDGGLTTFLSSHGLSAIASATAEGTEL